MLPFSYACISHPLLSGYRGELYFKGETELSCHIVLFACNERVLFSLDSSKSDRR